MGLFDWLFGNSDDEEEDTTDVRDWVKDVADTLKEEIESGNDTSWFDKLFGGGDDEDDDK